MSNIKYQNNVINDKTNTLPSDSLKSTLVKDPSIIEGTKINVLGIKRDENKYEISGKVFCETQFKMDDDKYLRFEIREDTAMASDDEASTPTDLTADHSGASTDTAPLSLGIQKVPNGVIINSNVFVSDRNYHTLVSLDDGMGRCQVCETLCKLDDYQDHISSEEHLKNLESHLPLCKYDLCIIRKLHENYHCGVCNQIFDIKSSNEHFASKSHEDKLLFAINRVSDIMYDLDIHKDKVNKDDPYHFNAKAINNMNRVNDDDDECFEGFYDAYKPEQYINDNENYSTDESLSDIEEEILNPFSYASIAKKPQTTPKFVEAEIDGKKMNVRFDSWHMILSLKSNKYYCMACRTDDHISLKTDHCTSKEHLAKLKKCKIVEKYVGFLIRKVDHRLYHCAQCNNLQLQLDMEEHIETVHPRRKIKNITENNNIPAIKKAENSHTIWTESDGNTVKAKTSDYVVADSIESKIKELFIFCAKFTLPLLSYNMVLISNGFHCCLCEISTDAEGISRHIHEVSHVENMNRCPFIFKYNCNLIRLIKNCYHCAICNVTVPYVLIDTHIIYENHVQLLNKTITLSPTTQLIKDPTENEASTSKYVNSTPDYDNRIDEEKTGAINDMKHGNTKADVAIIENEHLNEEIHKDKADLYTDATESIDKQSIKDESEDIRSDLILESSSVDTDDIKNDDTVESSSINIEDDNNDAIVESPLNTEEFVFLKRKNVFAKVTLTSYNTLVAIGDGKRYCVLCSVTLEFDRLRKHVESRKHMDSIRKYKYLEKYEKHLLRQILHTYHCSVCNVMFSWRELNLHITWPIHREQLDRCHKIVKNNRRTDIKNGTKQITIELQKETLYTTYIEPKIKIGIYYEFSKNKQEISKKSKIVMNNGTVIKICWDSWHGFSKSKTGLRCCLCQRNLKGYERSVHSKNGMHLQKLEENFLKEYNPALIRKINQTTLNCVTCNMEVTNEGHIIKDHIKGKKHEKKYELLIKESSECNTYADCTEDIFTIE